ncbi:interleukin-36 alpha-like [Thamnophis elegans]|uniref:interleukin-36 alpha-like n=1 Tax=Thamnophis elegans TaxID=35005 RepID=UPI001377EDC9|nr:interleukin-36 alpha-like [Thamnophis elegans]
MGLPIIMLFQVAVIAIAYCHPSKPHFSFAARRAVNCRASKYFSRFSTKPIFMAPEKKKSCLSCVKSGTGQYQIELKEKDIKELYGDPKNAKAFTFYSKEEGNGDKCTFESAEFPGWFISTSSEAKKPIGLSQKGGTQNILFYFKRKS